MPWQPTEQTISSLSKPRAIDSQGTVAHILSHSSSIKTIVHRDPTLLREECNLRSQYSEDYPTVFCERWLSPEAESNQVFAIAYRNAQYTVRASLLKVVRLDLLAVCAVSSLCLL